MPTKKNQEPTDGVAPAGSVVAYDEPPPAAVAPAQPTRAPRQGLTIAAITVGSVLVAGALFGGGVAVGTHLPHGGNEFRTGQIGKPGQFGGGQRNGNRAPQQAPLTDGSQ